MWKNILKVSLIDWAKQPLVEYYNKQAEEMIFHNPSDYGYAIKLPLKVTMKDYKYTPNYFTFSFSVAKSDDASDEVVIGLKIKAKNTQNLSKLDIEDYRFTEMNALKRMLIDSRPNKKELDSKTFTGNTEEEAIEHNEFVYIVADFTMDLQSVVYGYIKQLLHAIAENYVDYGPKESDGAKTRYPTDKSKGEAWRSVLYQSKRKNTGFSQSIEKVEKMLEEIDDNWRMSRDETLPPVLIKYLEENGRRENDDTLYVTSKNKLVEVYLYKDTPENISSDIDYDIEVSFSPKSSDGESSESMEAALTRISGSDASLRHYAQNEESYNSIVEAHSYSKKKWKGLLSYLKTE